MAEQQYDRVRQIVLTMPDVNERPSHGAICFFVRNRRPLCYFHDNHRGDRRVSLWCPAQAAVRDELVAADPQRFFKPPTSARGAFDGWLGTYLDPPEPEDLDWDEITAILLDAYRLVAPASLVSQLDPSGRRLGTPRAQ